MRTHSLIFLVAPLGPQPYSPINVLPSFIFEIEKRLTKRQLNILHLLTRNQEDKVAV